MRNTRQSLCTLNPFPGSGYSAVRPFCRAAAWTASASLRELGRLRHGEGSGAGWVQCRGVGVGVRRGLEGRAPPVEWHRLGLGEAIGSIWD